VDSRHLALLFHLPQETDYDAEAADIFLLFKGLELNENFQKGSVFSVG